MLKLYSSILGLHKVFHSWDIFPYVNAQNWPFCKLQSMKFEANESTNMVTFIKKKPYTNLVGGWTNQFEKYACQNGKSSPN